MVSHWTDSAGGVGAGAPAILSPVFGVQASRKNKVARNMSENRFLLLFKKMDIDKILIEQLEKWSVVRDL